jgi:hypothetical protein
MLRIPHWLDSWLTVNCEILATCSSTYSTVRTREAEWTPLQTHYFSETLIAWGIEPGTSGSIANDSDH